MDKADEAKVQELLNKNDVSLEQCKSYYVKKIKRRAMFIVIYFAIINAIMYSARMSHGYETSLFDFIRTPAKIGIYMYIISSLTIYKYSDAFIANKLYSIYLESVSKFDDTICKIKKH